MACLTTSNAQSVDISGIVNVYSSVTAVLPCPNIVRVENPERFAVGDTVLLIQMKGVTADTTPGATFGSIMAANRAGRYERNVIDAVVGADGLHLQFRMLGAFEAQQGVQLVRIPSYASARVSATLTCPPWDGKTGGVLAISVRNTLVLDADITADGMGFDQEDGIARTDQVSVAGGLATAGRGGAWRADANSERNGGSGGAHYGRGGLATGHTSPPVSYGTGVNWLFMGGGGGSAGGSGASNALAKGGRGGGIVIIDAPTTVVGNDRAVISARGLAGARGQQSPVSGGGGGGAGGAVVIAALSIINIPTIVVDGGAAGNATSPAIAGGGGGGGVVLFGTLNPLNQNTTSYAGGGSAVKGQEGGLGNPSHNNIINEATQKPTFRLFSMSDDTIVCEGKSATLVASGSGVVAWTDGATTLCVNCDTLNISPATTSTYSAIITYPDGCVDTARIVVTVRPLPMLTLADPPPFCDSVVIDAPAGHTRYAWSNGDTTQTIVVRTARTLSLSVYDDLGCMSTASVTTRFRGDTVLAFESLPPNGAPLKLDTVFPSERVCGFVPVRNKSDIDLPILSARMARGVEISAPLAQFPVLTSPSAAGNVSATVSVCASAFVPGVFTDTLYILSACGEIACPLSFTVLETRAYTRCNVRVTSDGEIEILSADQFPVAGSFSSSGSLPNYGSFLVVSDLMGRTLEYDVQSVVGGFVIRGLPNGVFVLRLGDVSQLLIR